MMNNKKLYLLILALLMVFGWPTVPGTDVHAEGTQGKKKIWMDGNTLKIDDQEWNVINDHLSSGDYYLGNDITINGLIAIQGQNKDTPSIVTLDLCGHTIKQEGTNCVIAIWNGQFTLNDTSGGGKITGGKYGGIHINEYASFIMNGGSITGNTGQQGGGVVLPQSDTVNSRFIMNNGSITGNTATIDGGGVYIKDRGEFTMNNGSITGNTAANGGGVYLDGWGVYKLTNGTVSGNTASNDGTDTGRGGGVYCDTHATFEITNGKISENKAESIGGGVFCYMENATIFPVFKVSGSPTIKGNTNNDVRSYFSAPIIMINEELKGGEIHVYNNSNDKVAISENGYTLKESDAEKFFSNQDDTLIGALSDDGKYVVFKKTVKKAKITLNPEKRVYNGQSQAPDITVSMGTDILKEGTDYSVTYLKDGKETASIKDAGEYTVRVQGKGGYCQTVEQTFQIEPKSVTVSGITSSGKIYDGSTSASLVTENAVIKDVEKDDEVYVAEAEGAYDDSNAGTGKNISIRSIKLGGSAHANYTLAESGQQTSTKADIARKAVTIKAKDQTVKLNGNISLTPADVEITAGSLVSGQSVKAVTMTADTKALTESGTITLNSVIIQDAKGNDVTASYDVTLQNGLLKVTADESQPQSAVEKEKAKIQFNSGIRLTQTGSKLTLKWGKVTGATMYKVYGALFDKKMKLRKTINKGSTTQVSFKKLGGKKINLKEAYQFYVVAYKVADGKEIKLAKSLEVYAAGRKNSKYTNVKAVKVKKPKLTLKKGKKAKIKAGLVLSNSKKKPLIKGKGKKFTYASSDKSVATVSSGGKVTAKGPGKCTVYVYAANGCSKKVKVTVKGK